MGDGSGQRYPAALADRDSNGVVWTIEITGAVLVAFGLDVSTKGALKGLDMAGIGRVEGAAETCWTGAFSADLETW